MFAVLFPVSCCDSSVCSGVTSLFNHYYNAVYNPRLGFLDVPPSDVSSLLSDRDFEDIRRTFDGQNVLFL